MNDRGQIENLLHTYARGIDTGDIESVAKLFRHGSVCDADGNAFATGFDEVLAMYQGIVKIYPDCGTPKTQHVITNLVLDVNSDQDASGTSNYTVMQLFPNNKIECIIAGEYLSKFSKHKNNCRFSEHHMRTRITGDLSHHLLIDLDEIKERRNNGIT